MADYERKMRCEVCGHEMWVDAISNDHGEVFSCCGQYMEPSGTESYTNEWAQEQNRRGRAGYHVEDEW